MSHDFVPPETRGEPMPRRPSTENRRDPRANEGNGWTWVVRTVFSPSVLGPNLGVALVVGVILSVTNQHDALARGGWTAALKLKLLFNFVVPFTVASTSAAIHRRPRRSDLDRGDRAPD